MEQCCGYDNNCICLDCCGRDERRDKAKEDQALLEDADRDMYPYENPYDPLTGWKE